MHALGVGRVDVGERGALGLEQQRVQHRVHHALQVPAPGALQTSSGARRCSGTASATLKAHGREQYTSTVLYTPLGPRSTPGAVPQAPGALHRGEQWTGKDGEEEEGSGGGGGSRGEGGSTGKGGQRRGRGLHSRCPLHPGPWRPPPAVASWPAPHPPWQTAHPPAARARSSSRGLPWAPPIGRARVPGSQLAPCKCQLAPVPFGSPERCTSVPKP